VEAVADVARESWSGRSGAAKRMRTLQAAGERSEAAATKLPGNERRTKATEAADNFCDGSSNDAGDEAGSSPTLGGSSSAAGMEKVGSGEREAPDKVLRPRDPEVTQDSDEAAHRSGRHAENRTGNELSSARESQEQTARANLRRSGPILSEFPELARFFRQGSRNERGLCIHVCTVCSYATLNKTTLLYHVVGKHLDIKPFRCTQGCGAERGSYSNMRQHELRAHQIPYYDREKVAQTPDYFICSGCKRQYYAPLDLLRHFLKCHTADKSWSGDQKATQSRRATQQLLATNEVQRRQRVRDVMSIENLTEPSNDEAA